MPEVPIKEAAERLSVSPDTVRRRILKGDLQARKLRTPRGIKWFVEIPAARDDTSVFNSEVQALRELVNTLRAQVTAQQIELEARRKEVTELHMLLQQASSKDEEERTSDPRLEFLTPREFEILGLVSQGHRNAEIADMSHITVNTVESHLVSVYRKLGINNRVDLARFAFKNPKAFP